jgi:cytochrome P450
MTKPPEEHAENWDLRHQDFNDNDLLYDVYSVMRQKPFSHTEVPFLSATPGGAWVATRYAECYRILQDWQHFSSNPTPKGAEQLAGDLVITLDPPRQQKFRKVLNPYFSPARMKALRP